jgi:hypothetical protein
LKLSNLPSKIKPFSTIWFMKRRKMEILELVLQCKFFFQGVEVDLRSDTTFAPVTNETTSKIILIMPTLAEWEVNRCKRCVIKRKL